MLFEWQGPARATIKFQPIVEYGGTQTPSLIHIGSYGRDVDGDDQGTFDLTKFLQWKTDVFAIASLDPKVCVPNPCDAASLGVVT